jgi:hypothetical protein
LPINYGVELGFVLAFNEGERASNKVIILPCKDINYGVELDEKELLARG